MLPRGAESSGLFVLFVSCVVGRIIMLEEALSFQVPSALERLHFQIVRAFLFLAIIEFPQGLPAQGGGAEEWGMNHEHGLLQV